MSIEVMIAVAGRDIDRPIRRLASRTHDLGGRWLSSRFVHSGGLFAGVIKVDIHPETTQRFESELRELDGMKLYLAEPDGLGPAIRQPKTLTIEATDRPGLLWDITRLLLDYDISVEDTDCHRFDVANAGKTVLRASMAISAPIEVDEAELHEALVELNEAIRVTLEPAPAG